MRDRSPPLTKLTAKKQSKTLRENYAGLKSMPEGSYSKVRVYNEQLNRMSTHFICRVENCGRTFVKSTSLIVHYWRHMNVRPFRCNLCNTSFT